MSIVLYFEDCESLGDCNRAFVQWLSDNPRGYYLNKNTRRSALIHAVGCDHVFFARGWKQYQVRQGVLHIERIAAGLGSGE